MRSPDLSAYCFTDWRDLPDSRATGGALENAPRAPGVYVMRAYTDFGRWIGESDIVYIGSSKDVRQRSGQHVPSPDSWVEIDRVPNAINEGFGPFEVAWVTAASANGAKDLEAELLVRYVSHHGELPPLNRHGGLERDSTRRLVSTSEGPAWIHEDGDLLSVMDSAAGDERLGVIFVFASTDDGCKYWAIVSKELAIARSEKSAVATILRARVGASGRL